MGSPGVLIKDLEQVGNEFGRHDVGFLVPGCSLSIFRSFKITERFSTQIRAESFNLSNSPHFSNPSNVNISNAAFNSDGSIRSLNGFGSITTTNPLGRLLDQRNFRFGFRLMF